MGIYGSYLTEAYFGKSEKLLEIEKQIGVLRQQYSLYNESVYFDTLQKINRLFEDQFGMEVFSLHIIPSKIKNAYTIPIATRFDVAIGNKLPKLVEGNLKNGYKFKPKNNLCIVCTIYAGLLLDNTITDEEILAVILHEIGHNFADALDNDICIANKQTLITRVIVMILSILLTTGMTLPVFALDTYTSLNKTKVKTEKNAKPSNKISSTIKGFGGHLSDFFLDVNEFISRFTFGSLNWLVKLIAFPDKLFKVHKDTPGKKNEVLSDKFATIYGYGPALASVLNKMTNNPSPAELQIEKIPYIGSMMNNSYYNSIKNSFEYDEHPQLIQRINSQIDALKFELKKDNLDPKLRKIIQKELDELMNIKKELTEICDDKKKSDLIKATYNAYIDKKLPEAISKKLDDELNKEFDKLIEK